MIIDCVADFHGAYPTLEGGDLLIIAGDLTANDRLGQYFAVFAWIANQKYEKKILIAGNHDNFLQSQKWLPDRIIDFDYLQDSGTEYKGLKIWGSPWTKTFPGMNASCKAFAVVTDEELEEKWALIPKDTDILVTHCPPYDIMDECYDKETRCKVHAGSMSLLRRVCDIKPKLHVFGHIHSEHGEVLAEWDHPNTRFVNAAHMSEYYEPMHEPIRVIL